MIDLDQLSAFVAIAQRGTVTAAARKLHRSQSAISRRLSLLEHAVGAALFDRRGAKLVLTDVGRAFLPFAESALASVESGHEAARAQLAPYAGTVSLAIVGMLIEAPLALALAELVRAELKLRLLTTTGSEISRLVRRGEATLGVRYVADDDPDLACEQIGVEPLCVVASPQRHSSRWIGFPMTRTGKDDLGRLLRQQLSAAGIDSSNAMAVDSVSAQKRLVEAGMGLALLPESSVREELARGTLCPIDMPCVATTWPIVLISRRAGYISPAAREVMRMLREAFGGKKKGPRAR